MSCSGRRHHHYGREITFRLAKRIAYEILSTNEEILAVSIIEARRAGDVLASKCKESFTKEIGVFPQRDLDMLEAQLFHSSA